MQKKDIFYRSNKQTGSKLGPMTQPYLPLAQGRGGGLVVSILAFYSDDPSSIPALATWFVRKDENK